ncbi:uncharacterized oxidoreductase At4g09670-like [Punica granatum]|uniref:Uncharacterized oxidoreductase At4g09670-like n=1 Tax=Punica granatum TaxID=22663 RepID=A0A218XJI2_PUNGR|nr:uncharacterized oxidoreductase At4g09670-like [Punica granatum]OWM84631.1 hypothetical protein CDL15_Pgr027418 [Punica granatum]
MAERSDPIIKFGILGCNSVARLCRAISSAPSATLHAIAGHSLDEATSCALGNGFTAKLYGSYEELLGDREVEAVYVPLPTSLHARWAAEAARRGKHVLVEKPPALDAEALGEIIAACEGSGVQYMDATMWMHHPRTAAMKGFLSDEEAFGQLKEMHATFTFNASPNFLENDVRVKPDLDALGALGDAGWYCIRSILWATDYKLPKTVTALPGIVFNEAGVIMSCGASLHFEDDLVSTFRCSFLSHLTMDIIANGSKGSLHVYDYALPFQETQASYYTNSRAWFLGGLAGWGPAPVEHTVTTDLPQVVLMVEEFCRLVRGIKRDGLKPEAKWPAISMKTQLVLDKVKLSIERGYVPVEVLDG